MLHKYILEVQNFKQGSINGFDLDLMKREFKISYFLIQEFVSSQIFRI